jgi:hypothetical protein
VNPLEQENFDMRKTLMVAVALALAPAFALAGDDKKKADTKATASPIMTAQSDQFRALDKNNDGSLSQDELKAQTNAPPFATLDKDGDGKISAQEWADHQKGAAGPAGPAGSPGAAGATPASPGGATPSTAPSTGGGDSKKKY